MFINNKMMELVTKYRENKLSHAYLLETNNIVKAEQDILTFIKILNCPKSYNNTCTLCSLCNLINKNSLPSLKIIRPDGASIKKNQIEELKNNFGTMPIYSKYNAYILVNAECLNASSANSMLKFLEEPTTGIIGFFITTNKDIMIDTIKSRCQSLVLNYEDNNIEENLNISNTEYDKYIEFIHEYLTKVINKEVINHKKDFLNIYSERKDLINIFSIILDIYYNNFLFLIGKSYNKDLLNKFKLNENLSNIMQILQIITETLTNLSYNVNIELLLDKFVIEMRGIQSE